MNGRSHIVFGLSAILILVAAFYGYSQNASPAVSASQALRSAELRTELSNRVKSYYDALKEGDYGLVWEMLGPGLQREIPKPKYVERLQGRFEKWESLTQRPDVWLSGATKSGNPRGEANGRLRVRTKDGLSPPLMHHTTWLWLENPKGHAWYLAAETLLEDTPSGTPRPEEAVPPGGTSVEKPR
jgi:hypothetical protein